MNQLGITCFLSAARTGSFSETARELYMTRQAVSKNIIELEKEVGFPLFFRKCTPLTLTTAGEKMLLYYIEQDHSLSIAKRIFGAHEEGYPVLRIAYGRWYMPNSTIIDALNAFNTEKSVKLNVVAGKEKDSLEYLRTGEADVAFLSSYVCSMIKEPYTAVRLSTEPIRIALPEDYPIESTDDIDRIVRDLPYLTCAAGENSDAEVLGRVNRAMMYFKDPPCDIVILPNVETIQLQVMLGHGFTCIPNAHKFSPHIKAVDMPPRESFDPSVTMCMVWLNRNQNREILNLRDWILENGGESND